MDRRAAGERSVKMTSDEKNLIVFPYWNDNPYQNMLYLATRAAGWTLKTTNDFDAAIGLLRVAQPGDVFHLHWTAPIVQRATTREDAEARLTGFVAAVDSALSRGVQLIWTIHNKLPHEVQFHEEELRLIEFLLDRASAIHTISPGTEIAVSDEYIVPPGKVMNVPHASYNGVYDQSMSRAEARARWELDEDDKAILFFGQMRPYKGLGGLLNAVQRASDLGDRRVVLMLAGKTSDDELPGIEALLPRGVRTIRQHSYVSDVELPVWFTAADLAVFPYDRVLNSSSVHLAATFGLPTALPDHPHVVEEFGHQRWVQLFRRDDRGESLAQLILNFDDRSMELRTAAHVFADSYTPYDMARRFLASLTRVVSG